MPDFFGAGLTNDDGQITSIVNNAFIQNNAFFGGGGIANSNNGTITSIARNTFDKNNSVFAGAGIYNLLGAVITTIENNTFSGNTGSHAVSNESLITEISNSTFFNNGIGIHTFAGTISSINNSIIDACLTQNGGVLNGSNNLSDDINHSCPDTSLTSTIKLDSNLVDNGCSVPLVDNTCVKTHALLTGSDAIDQGDANASASDQRGLFSFGARDIGAIEFNGLIVPQYTINIQLTGLAATNSVSFNNGTDNLTLNSDGIATISTLEDNTAFSVSITSQPDTPNQTCEFTNENSGTLAGDHVTVLVNCTTQSYLIGGTLTGLINGNSITLQNNLTDEIEISSNGSFVFTMPILDQQDYNVTIKNQPNNPIQPCDVINGNASVAGSDVTTIEINCEIGDDLIFSDGFD